ncbi:MAG: hypothetical protein AAF723_04785 [Pseudomonadota bacterium]
MNIKGVTGGIVGMMMLGGVSAQAGDAAVEFSIGTTGISAGAQWEALNRVVFRGGYNYLTFSLEDEDYDGVVYDAELEFNTLGGFVDFHPYRNGLTLTGGFFLGDKVVNLDATPTEDVEIGSITFRPEDVGVLDGTAEYENIAPYLGIGWDNTPYADGDLSFFARAGVMFMGSPDIELNSTDGLLSDEVIFNEELQEEEENLEEDLSDYEYYPVVNVGLSYKF